MDYLPYVWIAVMIVMAVIEGVTTQLVSIWFVVGALAAAVVAFFVPSFTLQFILFAVVSLVCLAATRPLIKKAKKTNFEPTNADRNIGKTAVVTEEINNTLGKGQVVVSGNTWTARTADNTVVPVGSEVRIDSISGVKLIVSQQRVQV